MLAVSVWLETHIACSVLSSDANHVREIIYSVDKPLFQYSHKQWVVYTYE